MRPRILLIIVALAGLACSDDGPAAAPDLAVDSAPPAPDMQVPDLVPPAKYPFDISGMKWANVPGGATVPPASLFANKVVFVKCFQAWCPGCHSYGIPMAKLLMDKYKGNPNIVFVFLHTVFEGHSYNTFDKGLLSLTDGKTKIKNPLYAHEASKYSHQATPFMKTYKTGGTPSFVIFRKDQTVAYSGIPRNGEQLHDWVNIIDPLLAK